MILRCFCVFDVKAAVYMQPWCAVTDAVAVREFARSVNATGDSPMVSSPDDFTLFRIGSYDDSTGLHIPLDAPVSLGNGVQFKRVQA